MTVMTGDPDARWREIAGSMARWAAEDPVLAEELISFNESAAWVIRWYDRAEPIRCEMCGTPVCMAPEAEVLVRPWVFRPGIWENGTARRHTLRRCTWQRDLKMPG